MDWDLAIERNRVPLLRLVVVLFSMLGLAEDAGVAALRRLPLVTYRSVLSLLRPAEWAVRRLVVVVAHRLVLLPRREVAVSSPSFKRPRKKSGRTPRVSFQLFDPRKTFSWEEEVEHLGPQPRIRVVVSSFDPRIPWLHMKAKIVDVNAAPLLHRLVALRDALGDLPRQAQRYLRWKALPMEERRPRLTLTLRPGAPPGYFGRGNRGVDEILRQCHQLISALPQPAMDSS